MKNQSILLRILLCAVCSIATISSLGAQKQPQDEPDVYPTKKPTPIRSIPILMRHGENTANTKLASLLETLSDRHGGKMARKQLSDRIRAVGEEWRLDVFGDGSGAEFLDQKAANRAHKLGVEPAKVMSAKALESSGRTYINRYLGNVIVLQQGESLVPVATSYRKEGGVDRHGNNPYSAVVANRIIFSREINGIPVVGAGSKVTVTFLNDGTVESFRYDWPIYSPTGREQSIASSKEILQRIQQVAGVRTKSDLTDTIAAGSASIEAMKGPIHLSDHVQIQDLKCGYYDPGYMNRDSSAPVQSGCYYHMVHTKGSGEFTTVAAYSGAVPSALNPEEDNHWPEAAVLRGQIVKAPPPPKIAGSSSKSEPVQPRPKQPKASRKKDD